MSYPDPMDRTSINRIRNELCNAGIEDTNDAVVAVAIARGTTKKPKLVKLLVIDESYKWVVIPIAQIVHVEWVQTEDRKGEGPMVISTSTATHSFTVNLPGFNRLIEMMDGEGDWDEITISNYSKG